MHRVIAQLRSAELCQSPNLHWDRAKSKTRGAKKKGHSFEEQVGRRLRSGKMVTHSGQWIRFTDLNGHGHAQPDHFLILPTAILLYECKLTQTIGAFLQMAQLYVPLLEHIYGKPVMTLQVCKNLRYPPEAERTPEGLIAAPEFGNFTWHLPLGA